MSLVLKLLLLHPMVQAYEISHPGCFDDAIVMHFEVAYFACVTFVLAIAGAGLSIGRGRSFSHAKSQ